MGKEMKINLTEEQREEIVACEMKHWFFHFKKFKQKSKEDKELMKSFKLIYEFNTSKEIK